MDDVTYRHWTKRLTYTAGVKHLADQGGAHWLIDLIASHQHDPLARAEEFQVWHLKVEASRSAMAWMTDGNSDVPIIAQSIEYSDYPEPECELFLVLNAGGPGTPAMLMLPSEY